MSNAYDMAEATYDELIARGFCLYDLFRHYIEGDIVYWRFDCYNDCNGGKHYSESDLYPDESGI